MAQTNISLLDTTSIHSYSSQTSEYPWSNLLDNYLSTNGLSARGNPRAQWVIIDLGTVWPLSGFKLWNSTFPDKSWGVGTYAIDISEVGTNEDDFTQVISNTFIPIKQPDGSTGYSVRAIPTTSARYVRLNLLTSLSSLYIAASQFEIYSILAVKESETILSDASIFLPTETQTILSDAFIYIPTYTDSIKLYSDAEITDTKSDVLSDAFIVDKIIYSDAEIKAIESATILSDAYVYRNKTYVTDVLLFGTAHPTMDFRNTLIYTTDISSSDETVVKDIITGSIIDMETVVPPLGYKNYDWKYDWVVRTFNKCQYKFEVRSAENLLDLESEIFHEISLDEQIYKGFVDRYYQWRCHVWASGSGDFELHQFTIKGYVDYPANPLYRTLYEKPFITTSHVKSPGDNWTKQLYEPPLTAMFYRGSYIPGDVNADNQLNSQDSALLIKVIFGQLPESSIPSPGFENRGLFSDFYGHTSVNIQDVAQLVLYLQSAGEPPSRLDEII